MSLHRVKIYFPRIFFVKMVVRSEKIVVAGFGIGSVGTLRFVSESENARGYSTDEEDEIIKCPNRVCIWYRFDSRQGQKVFSEALRPALGLTKQQPRYLSNFMCNERFHDIAL